MLDMKQAEANRALVDEERVAALLADVSQLLTEGEQAQLRECARVAVEQQSTVSEIGLEAASRASTSEVDEFSRREAIARYYFFLILQQTEAAATENKVM